MKHFPFNLTRNGRSNRRFAVIPRLLLPIDDACMRIPTFDRRLSKHQNSTWEAC